jgi:2-hydroxy-6-oxonona-2,4-dienedioate hydrolase
MTRTVWPTPDRSRLLGVAGVRVFVTDVGPLRGEAPPLVLLHDVPGCAHSFAHLLESVAPQRRYLAIDLPGCGESDRPEPGRAEEYRIEWIANIVASALRQAEVEPFELLGQGFGALVAMAMAADAPHSVTRIVACGVPRDGAHLAHEMRLAGLPGIGTRAFARAYRRADLERTLRRWRAAGQALEPLTLDVYWDRLGRAGGVEATCAMLRQLEFAPLIGDRFAGAGVPTVLLWGDREVIGESARTRWREVLPHAQEIVLVGCGHAAVEERPAALAEALGWGEVAVLPPTGKDLGHAT